MENLSKEIEQEAKELASSLLKYQYQYYVLGNSEISDFDYDNLFDKLVDLEKRFPELKSPESPTQRVGSDLTTDFPEFKHTVPVLSLDKAYSIEEVLSRASKSWVDCSFVAEEKIDGVSIVLYYKNGVLDKAVTRGDGAVGNIVTSNIKTIGSIPLIIDNKDDLVVRGEVYLPKKEFEILNKKLGSIYANPRNLAAGAIRRKMSLETAQVPLQIFVYEGFFKNSFSTHKEILEELSRLGFRVNKRVAFFKNDVKKLENYIKDEVENRDNLDYEIDGLVIKVNEISVREDIGYTNHHPRWAIAYKFESPTGETILESIDFQVGRTGRITPVARIKPVKIGGSVISNVTLHNEDYIDFLDLTIGSTVLVSKRGDVIPAIEEVLKKVGNEKIKMPDVCPCCSSKLEKIGAHYFCKNFDCLDQVKGRLKFFTSKGQMNMENLGSETIDYLIDIGALKDVSDIFTFDYKSLMSHTGFGEKKIDSIVEGINQSKKNSFSKLLASLGLNEIGNKVASLLVKNGYNSFEKLLEAVNKNEPKIFESIDGIGEVTARQIISEIGQERVVNLFKNFRDLGFNLEESPEDNLVSEEFKGQKWCITGSFENFKPRSLAGEEVEKRGGVCVSSVSSKTTHLLAGESAGSKLEKAKKLGVKIVSEKEFLNLLGGAI